MQLYPAIDMKDGKCVRLTQGLFDDVKVYGHNPCDMAKLWVSKGATFLHVVDLDGALAGRTVNESVIQELVRSVDVPIQLGGGIRSRQAVEYMLNLGISRVIIGTKAVKEPEFIRGLVEEFGAERIVCAQEDEVFAGMQKLILHCIDKKENPGRKGNETADSGR